MSTCVLLKALMPSDCRQPLIKPFKVPSCYLLVEQLSNIWPSVGACVNHIGSPASLLQMASIIALFHLQMFYSAVLLHSQLWDGTNNVWRTIFPLRFRVTNSAIVTNG